MPVNILAPRVPSVSQSARNALAIRNQKLSGEASQVQLAGAKTRNLLAEKQLQSFEGDREIATQQRGFQNEARAISTALKAGNSKQATQIYKSLGGKSENEISIVGDDVSIDYKDSTIKGPSNLVSELMEQIGQDPTWMTDPKKAAETRGWMAAKGISFEQKEVKQTTAEKLADKPKDYFKKNPDGSVTSYKLTDTEFKGMGDDTIVRGTHKAAPKETDIDAEEKKKTVKLKSLKDDYFKTIGRYYSAQRGVGQYVPDENKEKVAAEALEASYVIAKQFKELGGDIAELGKSEQPGPDENEMVEMPPPTEHSGRTIKDTKTGKRFKSNGTEWVEVK